MMKVQIHYLFSNNEQIGSKLIQWGTSHQHKLPQTPSHVALLINDRWVFESTLFTGIRVIPYKKWLEINQEVFKIKCIKKREYTHIKKLYKEIKDKYYDWPGIVYLGFWLILNKIFKIKVPKINRFEQKCLYFCCEGVAELLELGDYGMKTPADMLVEIQDTL